MDLDCDDDTIHCQSPNKTRTSCSLAITITTAISQPSEIQWKLIVVIVIRQQQHGPQKTVTTPNQTNLEPWNGGKQRYTVNHLENRYGMISRLNCIRGGLVLMQVSCSLNNNNNTNTCAKGHSQKYQFRLIDGFVGTLRSLCLKFIGLFAFFNLEHRYFVPFVCGIKLFPLSNLLCRQVKHGTTTCNCYDYPPISTPPVIDDVLRIHNHASTHPLPLICEHKLWTHRSCSTNDELSCIVPVYGSLLLAPATRIVRNLIIIGEQRLCNVGEQTGRKC